MLLDALQPPDVRQGVARYLLVAAFFDTCLRMRVLSKRVFGVQLPLHGVSCVFHARLSILPTMLAALAPSCCAPNALSLVIKLWRISNRQNARRHLEIKVC